MLSVKDAVIRGQKTSWIEHFVDDPEKQDLTLVFIHGFPDNAHVWEKLMDELSGKYNMIAPFLRGTAESPFASSGSSLTRFSPDSIVLDHAEILRVCGPKTSRNYVLIGHDIGCAHTYRLAQYLQDDVKGVMFLSGMTEKQMLGRFLNLKQQMMSWYIYVLNWQKISSFLVAKFYTSLRTMAYKKGGLSETSLNWMMLTTNPNLQSTLHLHYQGLVRHAFFSNRSVRRVPAEALVVWGHDDVFLVSPNYDEFRKIFSGPIEMRILEGHHWLQVEKPKPIATLLLELCERVAVGSSSQVQQSTDKSDSHLGVFHVAS